MICIYKITSPSGRIYIGCTLDYEARLRKYKTGLGKGQHKLYNSLVKYGFDSHKFEVVEETTKELIYSLEKKYISEYNSIKNGLNIHAGGKGGDTWSNSDNRDKIIEKLKDRKGAKNPNYNNTFTHSKEAIRKMMGKRKHTQGAANHKAKATKCVELNKDFGAINEIAAYFKVTNSAICNSFKRNNMTFRGMHFEYTKV